MKPTHAEIRQMLIDLDPEFRKASALMVAAARYCVIETQRRMEAGTLQGKA